MAEVNDGYDDVEVPVPPETPLQQQIREIAWQFRNDPAEFQAQRDALGASLREQGFVPEDAQAILLIAHLKIRRANRDR